ncbi:hypothetical protein ACLOJK_003393 [Asimina triloba]
MRPDLKSSWVRVEAPLNRGPVIYTYVPCFVWLPLGFSFFRSPARTHVRCVSSSSSRPVRRCPGRVRCGGAILAVVVFIPSSSCRSSAFTSPISDSASSGPPLHRLPAVPHQIQRPPLPSISIVASVHQRPPVLPCFVSPPSLICVLYFGTASSPLPLPSVSSSDRTAPPLELRLPAVPAIPAPPGGRDT